MDTPADFSTHDSKSADGYIREVYTSPATWMQVVSFYNHILPASFKQAGPPIAIFQLAVGVELYIIKTDDPKLLTTQATRTIWHLPLAKPDLVTAAVSYATSQGAKLVLPPTLVWALPLSAQDGYQAMITMSIIRFQTHQQLTSDDTTVGVIHNPNW
ncbi:hypothetical protein J7E24_02635 [Hymenobacter sp. ISL-91]|uniref:hypothetical protein n=1 Tax=Hymenobacter sp. ISL-91 TaxID=2819151 RepID=UPI001BE6B300|nr:hypothetical protein [Hymenobacter sp. ISL-91]MBT2556665.1 hypothetical protein [Hymenobacter sp. ISL-91]